MRICPFGGLEILVEAIHPIVLRDVAHLAQDKSVAVANSLVERLEFEGPSIGRSPRGQSLRILGDHCLMLGKTWICGECPGQPGEFCGELLDLGRRKQPGKPRVPGVRRTGLAARARRRGCAGPPGSGSHE